MVRFVNDVLFLIKLHIALIVPSSLLLSFFLFQNIPSAIEKNKKKIINLKPIAKNVKGEYEKSLSLKVLQI